MARNEQSSIDQFVIARRQLLRWREAKRKALIIAELHFPKSHPFRRGVANICTGEVLGEYRYHADVEACRFADKHGDELFRRNVDGVALQSPIDFFYGDSLRAHERGRMPDIKISSGIHHGKTLKINEISRFHDLAARAAAFVHAVKQLPTVRVRIDSATNRRLRQCEDRFLRSYDKVLDKLRGVPVDHRPTYEVLMCLSRIGLQGGLSRQVIDFVA